jgi:hypothetical protein
LARRVNPIRFKSFIWNLDMNMQTGPAPKQSLDQWLLWTGIIEIANIAIFSFLGWDINRLLPGNEDILSILGLLTLNILLLEGGIYWLFVRARFFQKTSTVFRFHLLQAVYTFNILLLLVFPGGLWFCIARQSVIELSDLLLGTGFFIFGFGEFLHYFIFKINMRPSEWKYAVQNRQFVPARLLRELRRAKSAYQQEKKQLCK